MKPVLVDPPPASDNPDGQSPLRPGLLVADSYRLIEELGAGAMGAVWKAQHVVLGHGVAIKFLRASLEAYPQGRIRFEREGKLAARLGEESRHICRVTDYGVMTTGTPFVVMELLQGEELGSRLRRQPVLELGLVAEIVGQLCRALMVAHRAGVVHRDLKPANVFLCAAEDGQPVFVKLLDFGVAHAPLEDDTEGTRQGVVFGTPSYTSPEQISGEPIDGRADLWSVAVIAYRMATGKPPFGTGALHEIGLRILTVDPPAPSSVRPELPPAFDAWMKKALAKQRDQRFASALELSEALHEASGASHSWTTARSGLLPMLPREAPSPQRRRWWLEAALLMVGLLALLIAWAVRREAPRAADLRAAPELAAPAQSRAREPELSEPPAPRVPALANPAAGEPAAHESGERSPPAAASDAGGPQTTLPARATRQASDGDLPSAAQPLAPRARESSGKRGAESKKRPPAPDTLKVRAAELWNKTDEL